MNSLLFWAITLFVVAAMGSPIDQTKGDASKPSGNQRPTPQADNDHRPIFPELTHDATGVALGTSIVLGTNAVNAPQRQRADAQSGTKPSAPFFWVPQGLGNMS